MGRSDRREPRQHGTFTFNEFMQEHHREVRVLCAAYVAQRGVYDLVLTASGDARCDANTPDEVLSLLTVNMLKVLWRDDASDEQRDHGAWMGALKRLLWVPRGKDGRPARPDVVWYEVLGTLRGTTKAVPTRAEVAERLRSAELWLRLPDLTERERRDELLDDLPWDLGAKLAACREVDEEVRRAMRAEMDAVLAAPPVRKRDLKCIEAAFREVCLGEPRDVIAAAVGCARASVRTYISDGTRRFWQPWADASGYELPSPLLRAIAA